MRPRRFLPSVNLLLAFDAVVRHRSVTAAAQELSLTQSTVSRLILSLEAQLGQDLFQRQRKRLVPTSAALTYQQHITKALDMVQQASMAVVANPDGGTLSLAVLPTFAARWLGPRLGDFMNAHPGVAVNMSTRLGRPDFAGGLFDAAIAFGADDWAGLNRIRLFDEAATACVSPDFARAHPLDRIEDLSTLPLLHLQSRPQVWGDWFAAQSGDAPLPAPQGGAGMMMDQFSMMIQAAISGLGIALLPHYLAQIEITEGRLLPVLQPAVPVRGAYWLLWPEERAGYAPLEAFRTWLESQPK